MATGRGMERREFRDVSWICEDMSPAPVGLLCVAEADVFSLACMPKGRKSDIVMLSRYPLGRSYGLMYSPMLS